MTTQPHAPAESQSTPPLSETVAAALARARTRFNPPPPAERKLDPFAEQLQRAADAPVGGPPAPDTLLQVRSTQMPPDDDDKLEGLQLIKRFVELKDVAADAKSVADAANARIEAMTSRIAEWLAEQDIKNLPFRDVTVYVQRQLWVSYATPVDLTHVDDATAEAVKAQSKAALIDALKHAVWEVPVPDQPGVYHTVGTGHLIHEDYHPSALAALVRDLPVDEHGEPMLPPELKKVIRVYYNVKVCTRKTR